MEDEEGMIIKIGEERRGEYDGHRYIDGCENIRVKSINLGHLTYKYQEKFSGEDKEQCTDLQTFVKGRLEYLANSAKEEDKCDFCYCDEEVIVAELKKVIEWTFDEFQMDGNDEDLRYLAKCLCGEEKVNFDSDEKLNAVYYNKGDKTYVIYSIYSPIYLLNNEGKTIDVIR